MKQLIIGITGTLGAGKDTTAEYLVSLGFAHISLSGILREIATEKGLGMDRDTLRELGNELSKSDGEEALAIQALERTVADKLVVSSIRKPKEIEYFKSQPNFTLLFIDAPVELRHERMVARGRDIESQITIEEMTRQEELESSGKSSQRLDVCRDKADMIVDNSGTFDDLFAQIDNIVKEKISG